LFFLKKHGSVKKSLPPDDGAREKLKKLKNLKPNFYLLFLLLNIFLLHELQQIFVLINANISLFCIYISFIVLFNPFIVVFN